ncbi:hypothetical protein B0A55_05588 [Friedmanniomyces simplex]|uniref:Uncharacterized protein n=1 Tax=Friedmanniomyces simplex TaxID=329884 RepID=A0A4U0XE54_9PEZI|nr:hypothetical protein B0A55_05588 [Friedmanniomyces simplex]
MAAACATHSAATATQRAKTKAPTLALRAVLLTNTDKHESVLASIEPRDCCQNPKRQKVPPRDEERFRRSAAPSPSSEEERAKQREKMDEKGKGNGDDSQAKSEALVLSLDRGKRKIEQKRQRDNG